MKSKHYPWGEYLGDYLVVVRGIYSGFLPFDSELAMCFATQLCFQFLEMNYPEIEA